MRLFEMKRPWGWKRSPSGKFVISSAVARGASAARSATYSRPASAAATPPDLNTWPRSPAVTTTWPSRQKWRSSLPAKASLPGSDPQLGVFAGYSRKRPTSRSVTMVQHDRSGHMMAKRSFFHSGAS